MQTALICMVAGQPAVDSVAAPIDKADIVRRDANGQGGPKVVYVANHARGGRKQ
jgi:hypothetical protein